MENPPDIDPQETGEWLDSLDAVIDIADFVCFAERLIVELKGKLADALPADVKAGSGNDVLNALVGLGYSEKEALAAVKGLPAGLAVTEGIRAALKALAKS